MLHITKEFPGIKANDDITPAAAPGRDPCAAGGKRRGQIHVDERAVRLVSAGKGCDQEGLARRSSIKDPNDANRLGIGMVHQHFKLVECFTVLDNIILGVEETRFGLSCARMRPAKRWWPCPRSTACASIPTHWIEDIYGGHAAARGDPEDAVPGQRDPDFRRAHGGPDAPGDRRTHGDHARACKAEGKSILFITHKLNEIMAVADRCTVLRRGRCMGTVDVATTTKEELVPHDGGPRGELCAWKKALRSPGERRPRGGEPGGAQQGDTRHNAVKGRILLRCVRGRSSASRASRATARAELVYGMTGLEKVTGGHYHA